MTHANSIVRPFIRSVVRPIRGVENSTRVFLLAGQSNMVGRADFDGGTAHPAGVWQYRTDGTIAAASFPLDHHGEIAGDMGLDVQFAVDFMAGTYGEELLFLPGAEGGTGFSTGQWRVGGPLYSDLVNRANALFEANPSFRLGGILWHQGERDSGYTGFESDLDAMIVGLRSEIAVADETTPFILGELVPDFVEANSANKAVNDVITDTPNRVFHTAVASSFLPSRLSDGGDNLHFDAASLRALGSRYHAALQLAKANRPSVPESIADLEANAENQQIVLSWTPPADGGEPITGYVIERSLDGATWDVLEEGETALSGYTDSGLNNGTSYHYRVLAVNSVGNGPTSDMVSAVPEAGAAGVVAIAFAATTVDSTSHLFTDIDVGEGGTVVVAAASRATAAAKGLSAITIGGQAATLMARNEAYGNYLRFAYVTGAPAGALDINLMHDSTQSRAGVHVWVLKNANPSAAIVSNHAGLSGSADATADGLLLGAAISVNPASRNIDWSGLDERQEWSDYGDTFGSGTADRTFATDTAGHSVSLTTDGNYKLISLLSVPKG